VNTLQSNCTAPVPALSTSALANLAALETTLKIKDVIASATSVVQLDAAAKSIVMQADACDCDIEADSARVHQILCNLLKNAIKFTPSGGKVVLSATCDASDVKFMVQDTGIGVDPTHLSKVFDRFNKQDGSTTRAHGGLGIGLSIVKHLVNLHNGRIEAYSKGVGQGATFTVWLPRSTQAAASMPVSASAPIAAFTDRLRGSKVLVVDDDRDTLEFLAYTLERAGAAVRCAGSVREAMEVIEDFKPVILISDIGMSGHDGFDLIRQLRQRGSNHGSRGTLCAREPRRSPALLDCRVPGAYPKTRRPR
jgi:CheY-like chemotaxis protein